MLDSFKPLQTWSLSVLLDHLQLRHSSRPHSLRKVKHLLNRLPPWRIPRLGARRSLDQSLLPRVGHLPPLADLGVGAHAFHVGGEVVTDVSEGGEEDGGIFVVEDAVCSSKCQLSDPGLSLDIGWIDGPVTGTGER